MTDHANPWLLAFLVAGCAVFLVTIVVVIRRLQRPKADGVEPMQMNDDQPVSGVHGTGRPGIEAPVFLNTIGKD